MFDVSQGDILSVEKVSFPVLVVSKNFFDQTEQIIACPIMKNASPDPLHIPVSVKDMEGTVLCEQLKLLDLHTYSYKKITEADITSVMDISDAIQGIFDYAPYDRI